MIEILRNQAKEIADAGINGWGNTMIEAADTIESLRQQLASREAEVAGLHHIIDEEAKDSALVIIECDQLREQVNMLQQLIYGLKPECDLAMKNTLAARIPECGDFGMIAQSLSYVIQEALAATELK